MNSNRTAYGLRAMAATAALGAALVLSTSSYAADAPAQNPPAPAAAPQDTTTAPQTGDSAPPKATHHMSHLDRVEARIKTLHQQLHITAAQETQWTSVAQAMRDNAKEVGDLVKERKAKAVSMTAVDDLHSYEAITDAHADGLKKLVPAFETLYASMSDDQKKVADTLFRHTRKPPVQHKT